jgi:hypothetical protein
LHRWHREEGFDRGGWFIGVGGKDKKYEAWVKVETDEALGAEALLLGRGSYEFSLRAGYPGLGSLRTG